MIIKTITLPIFFMACAVSIACAMKKPFVLEKNSKSIVSAYTVEHGEGRKYFIKMLKKNPLDTIPSMSLKALKKMLTDGKTHLVVDQLMTHHRYSPFNCAVVAHSTDRAVVIDALMLNSSAEVDISLIKDCFYKLAFIFYKLEEENIFVIHCDETTLSHTMRIYLGMIGFSFYDDSSQSCRECRIVPFINETYFGKRAESFCLRDDAKTRKSAFMKKESSLTRLDLTEIDRRLTAINHNMKIVNECFNNKKKSRSRKASY